MYSLYFWYLGAPATFLNPTITPSGRMSKDSIKRREEGGKRERVSVF